MASRLFLFAALALVSLLSPTAGHSRMDQQCDDEIEVTQREDRSAHEKLIIIAERCISKEPTDEFYRHVKGLSEYSLGRIDDAIKTLQMTADMQESRNRQLNRPKEDFGLRLGMTYWFLTTFKFYKATTSSSIQNSKELKTLTSKLGVLAGCSNLKGTPSGTDTYINQDERVAICVDAIHLNAWLSMETGKRDVGCQMIKAFKGKEYGLGLAPINPKELHQRCDELR